MNEDSDFKMEKLENQICPFCKKNELTLIESERDIPYFGKVYLYSMTCKNCKYHHSDVEINEKRDPVKYVFLVENDDDLNVRVIKSSEATISFGNLGSIEPGVASNGYITNIEGLINRFIEQLEIIANNEEEPENAKKAKAHLKKLRRVLWGAEQLKIVLKDPSGNSAIISEKAQLEKLK